MQLNFKQLEFSKKLFPEYMGIPIPVPTKIIGNIPGKFFMTKIHKESHSHINAHAITVPNDLVFFAQFFS